MNHIAGRLRLDGSNSSATRLSALATGVANLFDTSLRPHDRISLALNDFAF